MAEQLELLKQLQRVDGELFHLRRQQQDKPRELDAVTRRVTEQQARVKTAEDRLKALQLEQKGKELELQTKEGSAKKLQGQLVQVKTNKEYAILQHEISAQKADASVLEEAVIVLLDAIDQAVKGKQSEQQRLADEQARLQAATAQVGRELAEIAKRIRTLEQQRQTIAPGVPAPALTLYERILVNREGTALAQLINGACGGCNRRLPPQVVNEVFLNAKLVTCESCNRILYANDTVADH